jgi:hypothetical protein
MKLKKGCGTHHCGMVKILKKLWVCHPPTRMEHPRVSYSLPVLLSQPASDTIPSSFDVSASRAIEVLEHFLHGPFASPAVQFLTDTHYNELKPVPGLIIVPLVRGSEILYDLEHICSGHGVQFT